MAPCCQNVVTPRMIKAGQVSIGDKIQLEEEVEALPVQGHIPMDNQWQNQGMQGNTMANQTARTVPGITGIPGGVIDMSGNTPRQILPYSQMTSYMDNVTMGGTMENPSVTVPQSPLTPNGYQEEIDSAALQSFNGFLRTQIGRYMRIEQLVTSDRTEERLGFLVGVGSNFIILQDISTGNILVIDIFSIRLTYVYYSPAIVPSF